MQTRTQIRKHNLELWKIDIDIKTKVIIKI